MEIVFLGLEEIIEIHRDQIERYGGASGIRDIGLLHECIRISWGTIKINGVKGTGPLVGGSEGGQSPPFYSKIPTTFLCTRR